MNVTLITVGGRGDVQPIVALACGLKAAGHNVTVATNPNFEELVGSYGLTLAPVGGDPLLALQQEEGQEWLETTDDPVGFVRRLYEVARPMLDGILRDSMTACSGADAVVATPLALGGPHAAEGLGIPCVSAMLQPSYPTRTFPSPVASTAIRLGGAYNYLTHIAVEQLIWLCFRRSINRWRVRCDVGLSPITWPVERRRHPHLCAFSELVVPRPWDWPRWVRPTGYWFVDSPSGWTPPNELSDFLASGEPPVCIGFGSMKGRAPEALSRLVVAAVQRAKLRAVLLTGWGGLTPGDYTDDILALPAVPHDYLFPRVAAVVHHGGAGTTAAALRAGVPSLALPFALDQTFWGERIAMLGVGPAPSRQAELSVARLAANLDAAVRGHRYRAVSAEIGARLRAEDGVGRAVATFEAAVSRGQTAAAS